MSRLTTRLSEHAGALLHGRHTGADLLRNTAPPLATRTLVLVIVLAGALYGASMALYGARWGNAYGAPHVFAAAAKVPALFLLTLVVTLPSLHVFAALARSRLAFGQTVRLLVAATALSLVVLVSFAPVTVFFTFSTKSHPFLQLLNAAFFTVSGLVGMRFVWLRLSEALTAHEWQRVAADADSGRQPDTARAWRAAPRLGFVFVAWFAVYGSVAAQMGWLLRPFVGSPNENQVLFRETRHNIFHGLVQALQYVFE